MPRGKSEKPTFKPYDQSQIDLLPPTADELIPAGHLVRVVNEVVDQMDVSVLFARYDVGGGASRYHPVMLLKVLIYGYVAGVYTSRKIAQALRENVHFMWLSGRQQPDFRTINGFRRERLAPVIEEIFVSCVKLLAKAGYVTLKTFFIDGTKVEANANRSTFVWKRSAERNEEKIDEKLRGFLRVVNRIAEEEDLEYGERDLESLGDGHIPSELVQRMAAELTEVVNKLEEKEPTKSTLTKKRLKKITRTVQHDLLPRKRYYEQIRPVFGDRKSFSKTDPDATFMRMKDDHMRNGQLKPGYNVQVGTEAGFVLSYQIGPRPTDTRTLPEHLRSIRRNFSSYPKRIIADAGYGSEENYTFLAENRIEPYVKYNYYRAHTKKKIPAKDRYKAWLWPYDRKTNRLTCPEGHLLDYSHTTEYRSDAGFTTIRGVYVCSACGSCPVHAECTSRPFRQTEFSPTLYDQQRAVRRRLGSPPGDSLYRKRGHEVETVFGQTKANNRFTRFHLRGTQGVSTEWGLLMLGYNMKRIARLS